MAFMVEVEMDADEVMAGGKQTGESRAARCRKVGYVQWPAAAEGIRWGMPRHLIEGMIMDRNGLFDGCPMLIGFSDESGAGGDTVNNADIDLDENAPVHVRLANLLFWIEFFAAAGRPIKAVGTSTEGSKIIQAKAMSGLIGMGGDAASITEIDTSKGIDAVMAQIRAAVVKHKQECDKHGDDDDHGVEVIEFPSTPKGKLN